MNTIVGLPYLTGRLRAEMLVASLRLKKIETKDLPQESQLSILREVIAKLGAILETGEAALAGQVDFKLRPNGSVEELWK